MCKTFEVAKIEIKKKPLKLINEYFLIRACWVEKLGLNNNLVSTFNRNGRVDTMKETKVSSMICWVVEFLIWVHKISGIFA